MSQFQFIGAAKPPVKKTVAKPVVRATVVAPRPVVRAPVAAPRPVLRAAVAPKPVMTPKKAVAVVKQSTAVVKALPPKAKAVVRVEQKKAVTKAVAQPGTPLQKAQRAVQAIAKVNVKAATAVAKTALARGITAAKSAVKNAQTKPALFGPVRTTPVKKPAPKVVKKANAIVKALPPKAKAAVSAQQQTAVRRVLASNAPAAAKPAMAQQAIQAVNMNAARTVANVTQQSAANFDGSYSAPELNDESAFADQPSFESDTASESYDDSQVTDTEEYSEPEAEEYAEPQEEEFTADEEFADEGEAIEAEFSEDPDSSDVDIEDSEAVEGCVGCSVGAEPMNASGRGYWVKTHFYRDGDFMCAQTYLVANGEPEILNFRVNIRKAVEFVKRYHEQMHGKLNASEEMQVAGCVGCDIWRTDVGGIFGSIYNAAKSVVKSKLVNKVYGGVRSVLRSKALGAAVGVVAVAFPPVGVPAMAGYAAANAAIIAAEKGTAVAKEVGKMIKKGKGTKSLPAPIKKAATKAIEQGNKAKAIIKGVQAAAKSHPDPRKKADAQATLKVLQLTAVNRKKLKAIAAKSPNSVTGLVVDAKGNVLPGTFVEKKQANGAIPHLFLAAKGKTTRGYFQKVSGCIGCGG